MNTKKSPVQPAILRMQDAADYLSVSRAYIYTLVNCGELKQIKLGPRAVGIRRAEIDAWINTQAKLSA